MLLDAAVMPWAPSSAGEIVDTVGRGLGACPREVLRRDLGGARLLTLCTLLGLPVSTPRQDRPILGVGRPLTGGTAAGGQGHPAHLVLTFPGCGLMGLFSLPALPLPGDVV